MAVLPDDLLEWVCAIFDLVDEVGAWGALVPEGILLPMCGVGPASPMERGPIRLLPMLYRARAAGRAADVATWVGAW
eukprot:3299335-Lingulodinium_polyedra.AAC.1